MKYEIRGSTMPVVMMSLESGESVFTESGGMGWMSDTVEMSTNLEGGLFGGLTRKLSGESLFMTTYTARGTAHIAFPTSMPGNIIAMELKNNESLVCQKKSFLVADRSVTLEMHFRKKLGTGLFGGEGFILQKVTGPGQVFFEIDGETVEHVLAPGERLKVDTGHIAIIEPTVDYSIEMVKGFKNILFGGEGLFLATLTGPGRVWLQTMPIQNLAREIIPFIPIKKD
ncbi:MAG: hypothetical protein AVO33_07375 [delta proteobacterium ML8_F1]|nr:MAG: hypothetical protein AVO33_07375 [delta proteobacterium ML8_F1]